MKIYFSIEIDEAEWLDEDHETGLSAEGFDIVHERLAALGDDVQISALPLD